MEKELTYGGGEGIKIWLGQSTGGGGFQEGGMSKCLVGEGTFPHPPSRENPGACMIIVYKIKKPLI